MAYKIKSGEKKQKLDYLKRRLVDASYDYERVWGDKESLSKLRKVLKQIKEATGRTPKGYAWVESDWQYLKTKESK